MWQGERPEEISWLKWLYHSGNAGVTFPQNNGDPALSLPLPRPGSCMLLPKQIRSNVKSGHFSCWLLESDMSDPHIGRKKRGGPKRAVRCANQCDVSCKNLLFENAPVSLWHEDFSRVQQRIDKLRREGVDDIRSYFESHPEVVAECLSLVKILNVNLETVKLHRAKSKDELTGSLSRIYTEELLPVFREKLICLAEGKYHFESEAIVKTLDGQKIHTLRRVLLDSEAHDWSSVCVAVTDLTELKKAEAELKRQHQHLHALIQTIPDVVYFKDLNGRNLIVNKAFEEFTGLSQDEIIGKTDAEILPGDIAESCKKSDRKIISERKADHFEEKVVDSESSPVIYDTIKSPVLDETGNVVAIVGVSRDITERKRSESELKRQHKRLDALIQTIPDVIYFKDLEGRNLIVNKAFENFVGLSREDIIGKTCYELVHLDLARQCEQSDLEIIDTRQQVYNGETSAVIDGNQVFFEATKAPVFDENGNITAIVGLNRDITERKKSEEQLKQYKEIVSSSTDMLAILNKNFVYLAANNAYSKAFGLTPNELVGMTAMDLIDEDCFENVIKPKAELCLTGEPVNFLNECEFPVHGKLTMDIHYYPYRGNEGEVLGFVVNARDITKRKEAEDELRLSEERFRTLIDHAPYQILIHDLKGKILDANVRASRRLGYEIPELKQMTVLDIDALVDEESMEDPCTHIGFHEPFFFESLHRSKSGEVYPVEIHSTRVILNGEELIVSSFVDISHRKQVEEENQKLQDQLRHSQKMEAVGQLATGVAHEFNNALVGALSNAELLLFHCGKDLPENFRSSIKAIKHSTTLASDLTKQLLSFARKRKSNASRFNINAVITKNRKMLCWLVGAEITLNFQLAPEPLYVYTDEGDIERAVTNLVMNARDAMSGSGTLTIQTDSKLLKENEITPGCKPGYYVKLLVTDNGCGMPAEVADRIFEPFFTTKPVGRGTGLGLSTVFADVTNSGGFVTVESKPNIGTAITLHLPLASNEMETIDESSTRLQQLARGDETILVCDDEEIVLSSVAALLQVLGYHVLSANTPQDALQIAASHDGKLSLLFTDVSMPGMDGTELARKMKALDPEIKVLLTSGYTEDILQFNKENNKEFAFIQKPATFETLAKVLRKVLE